MVVGIDEVAVVGGSRDEVVFLDNGVIADRGSHDELVARSADYRNLVNAYDHAREVES